MTGATGPTTSTDLSLALTDGKNNESITLLWFDPKIDSSLNTEIIMKQLRDINRHVVSHNDLEVCTTYIQSVQNGKIFLIISGACASQFLPRIANFGQIDCIFIFCYKEDRYKHLKATYQKIVDICTHLNLLCASIRQQIFLVQKHLETFSFFDQNQHITKNLSKESAEFLWYQLFKDVILRLPHNQEAKQQMLDMCRHYYRGNQSQLKMINEFERDYQSKEAVRWYTKQSFIYKLVNKALKSEDIDQLYTFRFFIGDLSESLFNEHKIMILSKEQTLTVYRGGKLCDNELDKIKENIGKLISMNGYLSTSRLRSLALDFAKKFTKRTNVAPVLFQIRIQQINNDIVFADAAKFSEYPQEQEVLFDLSAVFRIDSIQEEEEVKVIRMTASNEGQSIMKNYIKTIRSVAKDMSVGIMFGRLMCDMGQYDKSLKYFEKLMANPNDEDVAWIEHNIGRALDFKGEWKTARQYYDRAYQRMMNVDPPRIKDSAYVLTSIGCVFRKEGKFQEALTSFRKSLLIREKFYSDDHLDIAENLNNMGCVLRRLGHYEEAKKFFERPLKVREKHFPDGHSATAQSLNNIGTILETQRQDEKALSYFQRALTMQEKFFVGVHPDIAHTLNNIGRIYKTQEKFENALEFYQKALKIREQCYSPGHPEVADSFNSIGCALIGQDKFNEAMHYFQQALEIQQKHYSTGHPDIVQSLNNIGYVHEKQRNYDKALQFCKRAKSMQDNCYPDGHPEIANTLKYIGHIYEMQRQYTEALTFYQDALTVSEKYFPAGHPDTAQSLKQIGCVLMAQKKYDEALKTFDRALTIQDLFYNSHPDTIPILTNMGDTLVMQKKYKEALPIWQRALTLQEKYKSNDHPDTVHIVNSIIEIEKKIKENH